MQDPEKQKFILDAISKIKHLKKEIEEGKKNKVDTQDLMNQVKQIVAEIQDEAEHVFKTSDFTLSPEELEVYLQNPSNFSKEDWELLEKMKKETAACKKEIIEINEGQAAKDLIKKGKKRKKNRNEKRA